MGVPFIASATHCTCLAVEAQRCEPQQAAESQPGANPQWASFDAICLFNDTHQVTRRSWPRLGMRSTFLICKEIADLAAAHSAALRTLNAYRALAMSRERGITTTRSRSISRWVGSDLQAQWKFLLKRADCKTRRLSISRRCHVQYSADAHRLTVNN